MNPTKTVNLAEYERSGGGKLGESYIHKSNPDLLLKLYSKELEPICLEEYDRACRVFRAGIPTPEPGELVRASDGRLGILYKRILGKLSYARALANHPERLEEYAADLARVLRQLHSTRPAPGLFPSAKDQYVKEIEANPFLTEEERDGVVRYIRQLPDADTALHGDLHHGNVIFTEDGKQYFIDLSDFCTGDPRFDLGILMLHTNWLPEEVEQELYHIDKATSKAFWAAFVPAYFGPEASLEAVNEELSPYGFLRLLINERIIGSPIRDIRPRIHQLFGLDK